VDPELTTPSRFGGGACEADETLFTCCRMTTGVFVGTVGGLDRWSGSCCEDGMDGIPWMIRGDIGLMGWDIGCLMDWDIGCEMDCEIDCEREGETDCEIDGENDCGIDCEEDDEIDCDEEEVDCDVDNE
jgi:hypothetical protein